MRSSRRAVLGALATLPFASNAQDNFPSKPIRMVIPFAAGGATDVLGRDLGQAMVPSLGQSFVVENIGGGAGVPALSAVSNAAADGYTVFFCASGNITAQPLLSKSRVDILSKVTPVGRIASAPHVLVVSAKAPFKTIAELIAYAKSHPGALNFASAGVGGLAHLGTELFARSAGIQVTHIPYKGAAQVMTDLVSGQVQAIFGTMPSFSGMIEKGLIRAIGITAPSKASPLRNLPLISQTVPSFTYNTWNAIFVPARTPATVVNRLYAAMKSAAQNPAMLLRFDEQGVDVVLAGPDELRNMVQKESSIWDKVIRDARIEVN